MNREKLMQRAQALFASLQIEQKNLRPLRLTRQGPDEYGLAVKIPPEQKQTVRNYNSLVALLDDWQDDKIALLETMTPWELLQLAKYARTMATIKTEKRQ